MSVEDVDPNFETGNNEGEMYRLFIIKLTFHLYFLIGNQV